MTDTKKPSTPLPRVDEDSKGYWEACARHELHVQRCRACGAVRHYPRALCTVCLADDPEWLLSSGRGTVYTYTVTYQNLAPGFRESVPYVLAYVELEEGVRVLTNIVDCPPDAVRIGLPVEVVFDDVSGALSVPKFRPVA